METDRVDPILVGEAREFSWGGGGCGGGTQTFLQTQSVSRVLHGVLVEMAIIFFEEPQNVN